MTDREKIIEIIKKNGTYNGRSLSFDYYVIQPDDLADALIAVGIGDVKEVERALDKAVELAYELRTEADTLSCSSCPMFHIFDSCKDRGLYKDCAKRWKEELIKQSKKELAEERKDD